MKRVVLITICALAAARAVGAQTLEGCGVKWEQTSLEFVQISKDHIKRTGSVEVTCADMKFFADEVETFVDKNLLVARGNVVFTQAGSRIGADRMEFNTKTKTGAFYDASGTVTLEGRVDRSMFGTQEPDAYFYGETLEKIGEKKYRITKGGFTTCVQPTPRWEVTSSSVVLTLDDYALLRNSLLRVKGVPVLYLPMLYYPIQDDDRATGFLIPVYGASTLKGQSISNAFFWAMGRSHDATFFHDWFSKTGQGLGGEYRYIVSPGSSGNFQTYWLDEHEADVAQPDGSVFHRDPRRSYRMDGGFNQSIGRRIHARGNINYFSDVAVQQLYNQDIYRSSNRQTRIGGNVTANYGSYVLAGTLQRDEVFYNQDSSNVVGSLPRISVARSETPIGSLPLYFQVNGEYGALVREDRNGDTRRDRGTNRVDVEPSLRVPFTRWPFLTVNSSASWRATWWDRSKDPTSGSLLDESVSRRFFDLQATITGPTLNRVFNTPGEGYAEKYKHIVEPSVTVQRISGIDVFDRILQNDGTDTIVGNVTRLNYGVTNRLYAKRKGNPAPREVMSLALTQTYYSDANAAAFDRYYQSSYHGFTPSKLSPVAAAFRVSFTDATQGELRTEYDTRFKAIRTVSASGTHHQGRWLDFTGSWSLRRYIKGLPGFDNPDRKDHYFNATTGLRTPRNRVGGTYSFNWDIGRGSFLQQRLSGYYNAQCCGVAAEFQTYNFGAGIRGLSGIPQDKRFTISVTLAGIGTFSPPFGGLGGGQGAMR
jgi:LPS-assembly protein